MDLTAILADAEAADGTAPVEESVLLTLKHHPDRVRDWRSDDGVALLVGTELSLVVRPAARGRGHGRALLERVLTEAGGRELTAWSHSDHPAARALAAAHGFGRVRELWVMRRPADVPLPDRPLPPGLTLRSYADSDAAELLRVNAAAFAHHPEQGAMDEADLRERMAEPWFDPAGLLVAVDDGGRMHGFHWTKRHSPTLGEVYVLGIDPDTQGGGLGKALTVAGLHHLIEGGAREVLLYVESDNEPAVGLYSALGFTHAARDTHVRYRRA